MKLHRISIKRAAFDKIPVEERTLLVLLAHAANELNILAKLFQWTAGAADASPIETKGNNTITLAVVRMLTGKLHEVWKLFEKALFGARLSKSYEPLLGAEDQRALQELKRYFGKSNAIEMVRNRHSFHYAPDQITTSYSAIPEGEELEFFLGEEGMNTLYYFADVVANRAMLNEIDSDHSVALEKLKSRNNRSAWVVSHRNLGPHGNCCKEALGANARRTRCTLGRNITCIDLMVRSNFIVLLRIGNRYILWLPCLTKLDQEEIAQK
jgi:hypothetical protein